MWFNIFMTVFGIFVLLVIGAVTYDCHHKLATCSENAEKGWKRAFEGWAILLFLIALDFVMRTINWITN
jgi:hypothetical protein